MFRRNGGGDVAERVAALVAIHAGIGQLADADAVEDDDDGAREHVLSRGRSSDPSLRRTALRHPASTCRHGWCDEK